MPVVVVGPSAGSSALKPLSTAGSGGPGGTGSYWIIMEGRGLDTSVLFALRFLRITAITTRRPTTTAAKALPIPIPTFSTVESPGVGGEVFDGVEVDVLGSFVVEDGMSVEDVVEDVVDDVGLYVGLWLGNHDIVPPRL